MLLQEALLMERKVLSILPRASERNWLAFLEAGIIPCATSREEVVQLLREMLSNPRPGQRESLTGYFPERCEARTLRAINAILDDEVESRH